MKTGRWSAVRRTAAELGELDEVIVRGYLAGAQEALSLWRDPLVRAVTSHSDLRPRDFQFSEVTRSFYFVLPPGEIDRLGPLIRVMSTQLFDALTGDEQEPGRIKRMLFLLDEFPRLGRMKKIQEGLTCGRSCLIKLYIVTQSLTRLMAKDLYGPHQDFVASFETRLFHTPKDAEDARIISELLGGALLPSPNGRTLAAMEYGKPLLTPGELLGFPDDELLLLQRGHLPVRAKKLRYHEEAALSSIALERPLPKEPVARPVMKPSRRSAVGASHQDERHPRGSSRGEGELSRLHEPCSLEVDAGEMSPDTVPAARPGQHEPVREERVEDSPPSAASRRAVVEPPPALPGHQLTLGTIYSMSSG